MSARKGLLSILRQIRLQAVHDSAVILAGGRGERMLPITEFQPKALVPIFGVPIIKLQIEQLQRLGIRKVHILTGHLGEDIQNYIKTQSFEIEVICIQSDPNFEPGKRLVNSLSVLPDEFLLLYCDNFIPDDKLILDQIHSPKEVSMILQVRDAGNIKLKNGEECFYMSKDRHATTPYVELGYLSIRSEDFKEILQETLDLNLTFKIYSEKYTMSYLILASEYQSVSDFSRYIRQGLQGKIMILDRDGILNEKMAPRVYLNSLDQLFYEKGYIEIFKALGSLGFNFVIASNQPGIATGEVAPEFLSELHRKITDDLRAMGVNILAFYVCMHHWDDNCECRKPKPGLLNQIVSDFSLTLNSTYFVGDEEKDMQAAKSAGIKGVKFPAIDFQHKLKSDFEFNLD